MRVLNCIYIALFMVMLTLPLVFVDFLPARASDEENRMLAGVPKLADMRHPETFVRDFDAWFKDSTGFRKQVLKLYNLVDRNKWINGVWYKESYLTFLIGKEGHHYSIHPGEIEKYQGKPFFTDEQLANMAAKLQEIKTFLDGNGIPFILMICADKESVYPEFFPDSVRRGPEPIQLDVITSYLQNNTTVDVFNIRQALLAEKNNYMLYPVVDNWTSSPKDIGHYNEIGAFFAYRELMRHINVYFPGIVPYEFSDVEIGQDHNGEARVTLKPPRTYMKFPESFFLNFQGYFEGIDWGQEAYANPGSGPPVILMMRDSYAHEYYLGKYLAQHFDMTVMIHLYNMRHFQQFFEVYRPDIVLFQVAERGLRGFADALASVTLQQ